MSNPSRFAVRNLTLWETHLTRKRLHGLNSSRFLSETPIKMACLPLNPVTLNNGTAVALSDRSTQARRTRARLDTTIRRLG